MDYFRSFCEKVVGFCKRIISEGNRPFDLKLSGYNKDYEVDYWGNFQAEIPS